MSEKEKIWTVSQVNSAVREVLEGGFMPFWITGEIGNLTIHRSGHVYLTLKDEKAQIRCVFFRGAAKARELGIEQGTKVELFGNLTVYEVRGEYQFTVRTMRPRGIGELQRRFEELKKTLAAEGLFDEERKKTIPILPGRIGIITSPEGAAIRDFLQIIQRRFPNLAIRIYPAPVQGKGAEKKLARGVEFFNRTRNVDVIILTRGGGSFEDLWPFNEEVLARALAESNIPVISAVGHEIDFTICDFASDMRVPTPSAAAELVVGRREEFQNFIADSARRIAQAVALTIERLKRRFGNAAGSYVFREPEHLLRQHQQRLDELASRGEKNAQLALERAQSRLKEAKVRLASVNPETVLKRGYSIITRAETGKVVTSPQAEGTLLDAKLAKGKMKLKVMDA